MPVRKGRLARAVRLSRMAAGLAGDAAGMLATGGDAALHRQAAERVAAALGELKGLPHKAGQVLSVLDDALPPEHRQVYAEVLGRLQAQARPLPWVELAPVVAADLGADPAMLFAEVEQEPAAAASIGQVHRARLRDGRAVAVKIQYPGVAEALASDLDSIGVLVGALTAVLPRTSVEPILRDLSARFVEELDYRHEARVQRAFSERWGHREGIVVPELVPELCGDRTLTSLWVEGRALTTAREAPPGEVTAWGLHTWRFAWTSVVEDGWLHGDPHPGNYLFLPQGRVAVLDYGCTQQLPTATSGGLSEVAALAVAGASDADLVGPLCRALGLPDDLDPALVPPLATYARALMAPVAGPQPFTFDRSYSSHLVQAALDAKAIMARRALLRGVPTPTTEGAGLLMRTSIGTAALLCRLGASGDFRAASGL